MTKVVVRTVEPIWHAATVDVGPLTGDAAVLRALEIVDDVSSDFEWVDEGRGQGVDTSDIRLMVEEIDDSGKPMGQTQPFKDGFASMLEQMLVTAARHENVYPTLEALLQAARIDLSTSQIEDICDAYDRELPVHG